MNFLFCILFINIIIFFSRNRINKFINIYDIPDKKRKFHKSAVPLSGGIIFFVNLIFISFYFHFSFNNYLVNEVFRSNEGLLAFFLVQVPCFYWV
jgi:UDP-N-acetylmuramyl pentapeptide phosphotransferase/UDP-N-acetylglucosamine-1-phosphate transferase